MNPKKQIIITSLILGLISIVFLFFVSLFLVKKIQKNSETIFRQRREFRSLANQGKELEEIQRLYNRVEPDFTRIDNFFLDFEVPVDFIKFLEAAAKDTDVSINISTGNIKKRDPELLWNYTDFQIGLSGSFSNFLKFIKKIESAPFLLEITNLSVQKSGQVETTQKGKKVSEELKANLSIKVFTK